LITAEYRIVGKVNMNEDWQNQIYLATIDKLDDYYNANAEAIINVAAIDQDGNFEMTGDNLHDFAQFYRLYLVKQEHSEFNACLFVGGDEHNFIHLILDNSSDVIIAADPNSYAPFGDYTISADIENDLMRQVGGLVYPSYVFYEIKFPSELQFSQNKLNRDLFHFADTCQSTLVSLAAINNTDFDAYFDTNFEQYSKLGEELKYKLKDHPYTDDYFRKMRYYKADDSQQTHFGWPLITSFLSVSLLFTLFHYFQLKKKFLLIPESKPAEEKINLTPQEMKILELIQEGKSNKEIASDLYVELSTVKSHINKLYSKMQVKNRTEAIKKSKTLYL